MKQSRFSFILFLNSHTVRSMVTSLPALFMSCSATSPLLSALVILSVVAIMGISAVFWFLHQKHRHGTVLTSFEYHPPFRSPTSDEACLVETEETEETDDMA